MLNRVLCTVLLTLGACGLLSCIGEGDQAIVPMITHTAPAGSQTLWMVSREKKLIKLTGDQPAIEMPFPARPETIFFLDENFGWVYAEDSWVWTTVDGGKNWTKKGTHPEFGLGSVDIVFSDSRNGWLVGLFTVFWTSDAGENWNMVYPNAEYSYSSLTAQPTSISVVDSNTIWLGMTAGVVLRTTDRGQTWTKSNPMGSDPDVHAIYAKSENEAWVGPGGGNVSGIYRTHDGGKSWKQLLDDPVRNNFGQSSITFTSAGTGWLVGIEFTRSTEEQASGVAFTSTDGAKWTRLDGPVFNTMFDELKFSASGNGWLVGYDHLRDLSYVYRTSDSGESWRLACELQGRRARQ